MSKERISNNLTNTKARFKSGGKSLRKVGLTEIRFSIYLIKNGWKIKDLKVMYYLNKLAN